MAGVSSWASPVLLIHGGDRNVPFSQSVDVAQQSQKQEVFVESLAIVGDAHSWLRKAHAFEVAAAIANYFSQKLRRK